jgi:hypothetical protein
MRGVRARALGTSDTAVAVGTNDWRGVIETVVNVVSLVTASVLRKLDRSIPPLEA